ncbi:MAG: ABC transporter permease [Thermotogota bacterium]
MKISSIKKSNLFYSLIGISSFVLIWHLISLNYKPIILPSPIETFNTLFKMLLEKETWNNILLSFIRLVIGYSLSLIFGVIIGVLMGLNEKINRMLNPIVVFLQTTPNISWILLAIIWFGLNYKIVVFTIFISIVPIIIINTREGIHSTEKNLLDMAHVYNLSNKRKIMNIYFPTIKPYVISAGIITIERAWKIGAMAELLSLDTGIGAGLYWARNNLETEKIFAWTIILVLAGFLSSKLIKVVFNKNYNKKRSTKK